MGDMMNNFLQGIHTPSLYYLNNFPVQKVAQGADQKLIQKNEQLTEQKVIKKKKNGGYALAFSSAIIPGSGQLFDGRFAPAAIYFIAPFAFILKLRDSAKDFFKNGIEFSINKFKHWCTQSIEKVRQNIKFTEKETFEKIYKVAGSKCFRNVLTMALCGFGLPVVYGMNIMDAYKGKRVKEIPKSDNNSENKSKLSKSEKNMIGVVGLLSSIVAGIALVLNLRKGKIENLSKLPAVVN